MIDIIELTHENKHLHNHSVEAFTVFGKLDVTFNKGVWSYQEQVFDAPYEKAYDFEETNLDEMVENPDKTAFYAVSDNRVLGQIVINKNWNKFCYVDNISVISSARRQGIACALFDKAQEWAVSRNLTGFTLETQDINLAACKLYIKQGFTLGAVDTMLYHNFDTKNELALMWYKVFT